MIQGATGDAVLGDTIVRGCAYQMAIIRETGALKWDKRPNNLSQVQIAVAVSVARAMSRVTPSLRLMYCRSRLRQVSQNTVYDAYFKW